MKFTRLVLCAVTACLLACTTIGVINGPKKNPSEDPKAKGLVSEYKVLADIMNIKFKSQIGVELLKIEDGDGTVGICWRMMGYRQIQLDAPYWARTSQMKRLTTIFHELTHCYCGRNHDFNGKEYPEQPGKATPSSDPDMYFEDSCPRSIMYPWVLSENCMKSHYGEYLLEMFKDCKAY